MGTSLDSAASFDQSLTQQKHHPTTQSLEKTMKIDALISEQFRQHDADGRIEKSTHTDEDERRNAELQQIQIAAERRKSESL